MSAPHRILILNDEEDGLVLLRHALEREFPGVTVLEFSDAGPALELLRGQKVDAVVTDNRMPRVSGIDFVRELRSWDAATPVIMLTGSDEKKAEARAAGVTTFICSGSWLEIREQIRRTLQGDDPGAKKN
jgi:CheY-like chemotaxis protein